MKLTSAAQLNEFIEAERQAQGLSHKEIADLIGMSVENIYTQKKRKTHKIAYIVKILDRLGFEVEIRRKKHE